MQVLADILGAGQSSRFYQHLVKEKQLAVSIQVGRTRGSAPACFTSSPRRARALSRKTLEKAIYEEIEAVQKDGVTAQEIEKARTQYLRSQIQSRQSSMSDGHPAGPIRCLFQ